MARFSLSVLNKVLVICVGIHKMLARIANREDTDQTASSESGSALFHCVVSPFRRANIVFELDIRSHDVFKPAAC